MRKFFTFVILALVAVSVWGTEVTIGSGTTTDANVPANFKKAYSLVEIIYTEAELLAAGAQAGSITGINFKYAKTNAHTRTWDIYVGMASHATTALKFDALEAANLVYSGDITTPTTAGWYAQNITFSTPYKWDGKSDIEILIYDHTGSAATQFERSHYIYTVTKNQVAYASGDNPYDPTSSSISCTQSTKVPQIKLIFGGGDTPEPTPDPTITATGTTNVGIFEPAFETRDIELTITGKDLTEDVAIACAEGLSCTATQIAKETVMAEGGTQVTISTTSDFDVAGTKVTFTSGTATKEVTIAGTAASYYRPTIGATYFSYDNAIKSPYFGYAFINAFELTISEVANNQFKPYNSATFKVDYSGVNIACAEAGKVSNLRGKFISNDVFKAFSFDYEAPELSAIVINENEDNSTDWPEAAQSGKELLITRTIVPNEWNSIVLPTDLTSTEVANDFGSGTDVEEFTGAEVSSSNITLFFTKKTNGIVAGVPYLIKPTQALPNNSLHLTNHSFTPTASTVTNNGIEFVGVLVPTFMDATGDDFIFVGSGNTLLHPSSAGTIKGMRAYFHVVGDAAKAAIKKSPMISLSTDATTAMTLVKPANEKSFKAIENGRIVINVQGKKIDVLGQTVK